MQPKFEDKLEEISNLETDLRNASQHYYEGDPIISDDEFNKGLDALTELDPNNKFLLEIGSGYKPKSDENKVSHASEIGSLDKSRDYEVTQETLPAGSVLTPKLDGGSAVAYYLPTGVLDKVVSRGDGYEGIDITGIMIKGKCVPLMVPAGLLSIRGEVMMSYESFDSLEGYSHPRNAACGISQSSYSSKEKIATLEFITYNIVQVTPEWYSKITCFNDILDILRSIEGLSVVKHKIVHSKDLTKTIESMDIRMPDALKVTDSNDNSYPIDGSVGCRNISLNEDDGIITYDSIAIKYESESCETTVTSILWAESGYGRLIPVIYFKSVNLSGANIECCSGFNALSVKESGIGPGAVIEVTRSNEVIPHWKRTITPVEFQCPTQWEGKDVFWEGSHLRVKNDIEARIVDSIISHNSEHGIGLSSLKKVKNHYGITTLIQLKDFITTLQGNDDLASEIYSILNNSSYNTKAVQSFLNILEKPRNLSTILQWSWTDGLGEVAATNLANICNGDNDYLGRHLENYGELDKEMISVMPSVTPVVGVKNNSNTLVKLLKFPFNWVSMPTEDKTLPQVKVTLTGKLSMSRSKVLEKWAKYGVVEASGISDSSYLICPGPSSSSKYKAALEKGINICNEAEFELILNGTN